MIWTPWLVTIRQGIHPRARALNGWPRGAALRWRRPGLRTGLGVPRDTTHVR